MNTVTARFLLFFLPATLVSNLVRFNVVSTSLTGGAQIDDILRILGESIAVAIFAVIAMTMLKRQRSLGVSLLGKSPVHVTAAAIATLVLYIYLNRGAVELTALLLLAIASFIYALFEETGWRGYLFAEFRHNTLWFQVLVPGGLWYLWHLSFLQTTSIEANLTFLAICLAASWGLYGVVNSTRSILAAATLHFAFGAVFTNQILKGFWAAPNQWIFLVGAFAISLIAIKQYERRSAKLASA